MRTSLFATGLLVVATMVAGHAEAQNYPWCAQYGSSPSAPTNCGFTSFQQCLTTVNGIGGFCVRNNMYVPPASTHKRAKVAKPN